MRERYFGREATGDGAVPRAAESVAEPVPALGVGDARSLLAQLIPGADVDLLVAGLLSEREGASTPRRVGTLDGEVSAPDRELRRVRMQFALGQAARMVQHAINNPLTALLAEAQLLELEPLTDDQRGAVARMVELTRRLVVVVRQLDRLEDQARATKE